MSPSSSSSGGIRPHSLDSSRRLGIDLGGTKIEVALLGEHGEIVLRQRVDTPQGDYELTLTRIAELVCQVEQAHSVRARIGIGTPGALSQLTGLMKNCNSTCLNGQPLQRDLERRLGRSIQMSNDANCFALAETLVGAAKGANVCFGVILGTGVGAGLVVGQQVLQGANRIAGEWGHNPLPARGTSGLLSELPRSCYCGRSDCVETYLSGAGLLTTYRELAGQVMLSVPELVALAEAQDSLALAALDRYAQQMALALAQVINILDPDVIVLGGGLGNIDLLYSLVPQYWRQWVFSDQVQTRLLAPQWGDSAGVLGAAWL